MVFDPNNYLDIWNIVAFEIIGTKELVMAIGIILLAFLFARNQVPFQTSIVLMIMWIGIFSILTIDKGLYALVVLVVGLLFYWAMSRMFRRN